LEGLDCESVILKRSIRILHLFLFLIEGWMDGIQIRWIIFLMLYGIRKLDRLPKTPFGNVYKAEKVLVEVLKSVKSCLAFGIEKSKMV
jgi:hypothetical protein